MERFISCVVLRKSLKLNNAYLKTRAGCFPIETRNSLSFSLLAVNYMLVSEAFPPHHVRQRVTWKISNASKVVMDYNIFIIEKKKVRQSGQTKEDHRQIIVQTDPQSVRDSPKCICVYWKTYVFLHCFFLEIKWLYELCFTAKEFLFK